METTTNMGLTVWDQPTTDDFSHIDLENNWNAIDQHDHSPTKGVQIPTAGIQAAAITSSLLAPNAVQQANIAPAAVGTTQLQDGSVTQSKLASGTLNFSSITPDSVDPNFLPLGTVLMWWSTVVSIPGGGSVAIMPPGGVWEVMDGRPWSQIPNSWGLTTGHIPDLRNRFPLGADITGGVAPAIGQTGGSNTIDVTHYHTVNPHHHGVNPHGHGIGNDGGHYHTLQNGYHLAMRQNAFAEGITVKDTSNNIQQNTHYTLYIENFNPSSDQQSDMDITGVHSHGGQTEFSDSSVTTDDQSPTTDTFSGVLENYPAYCALLFIMRCR